MVDSLVENSPDTAKIFYQTTAKTSKYRKKPEIKALPAPEMTSLILSPSRLPIPSRRPTEQVYHIFRALSSKKESAGRQTAALSQKMTGAPVPDHRGAFP